MPSINEAAANLAQGERFAASIKCESCGQFGSAFWKNSTDSNARLISVSAGFRFGESEGDSHSIACNVCDKTLP